MLATKLTMGSFHKAHIDVEGGSPTHGNYRNSEQIASFLPVDSSVMAQQLLRNIIIETSGLPGLDTDCSRLTVCSDQDVKDGYYYYALANIPGAEDYDCEDYFWLVIEERASAMEDELKRIILDSPL